MTIWNERVLLHATATVELNDLLTAVGEVTVTTTRIRFRPNRMDRLVWPNLGFEGCGSATARHGGRAADI